MPIFSMIPCPCPVLYPEWCIVGPVHSEVERGPQSRQLDDLGQRRVRLGQGMLAVGAGIPVALQVSLAP